MPLRSGCVVEGMAVSRDNRTRSNGERLGEDSVAIGVRIDQLGCWRRRRELGEQMARHWQICRIRESTRRIILILSED